MNAPRSIDLRPLNEARRALARGIAVRAMEAMCGTFRVAMATAPRDFGPTETEIWEKEAYRNEARQAAESEEVFTEGRIHRPFPVNYHE